VVNDLAHIPPPEERIPHGRRVLIIAATMLALFLGALDALVMSAAMPTVVSELGGLSLFSWVYSSYLLARAVSLPIFGKLADRLPTRALYQAAIGLFTAGSLAAGFAESMEVLIACRAVQVGTTVLALSLGWSLGSLVLGQTVDRIGTRAASLLGAVLLAAGCGMTLLFSTATSVGTCFAVFLLIGTGSRTGRGVPLHIRATPRNTACRLTAIATKSRREVSADRPGKR
jgi:MFS family permease